MAKFISDEEMANLEKAGQAKAVDLTPRFAPNFLTDAQVEEIENKKNQKPSEKGQAFLTGVGEGGTLGYGAQIQAAMLPAISKIDSWINDTDHDQTMEMLGDYTQRRDGLIKRRDQLAQENPGSYLAGQLTGGLATAAAVPLGAAKTAAGAGKLAKAAATAKQGAKIGVVYGALQNPGDTEGEVQLVQLGDRLDNAVKGAVLGGGSSAAMSGGAVAFSAAGRGLKSFAEKKAFKALGPYARDSIKAHDKNTIQSVGRAALDNDVVTMRPTTYDGIAKRATAAKDKKGQQLGKIVEDLDDKANQMMGSGEPGLIVKGAKAKIKAGVDRKAIANSMREDLINPNADIPGIAAKNARVENLIKEFEDGSDDLIGLLQAEGKKRSVGKEIKWDRLPGADIPIEEQVQRSLYSKLRQGVEDGAEVLDKQFNGKNAGRFRSTKNEFGALETAAGIANRRESREFANRFLSPSDYWMGGLGAAAGFASGDNMESRLKNAAIGAAVGGANKFARQQGNQMLASGSDKIASLLLKAPKAAELARQNPAAFQRLVQQFAGPAGEFTPQQAPALDEHEPLIQLLKNNPEYLERIQNPELKEKLRRKLAPNELDQDSGTPAQDRKMPDGANLKGREKWISTGLAKLEAHGVKLDLESLRDDPKAQELLMRASDLKPGSKMMASLARDLRRLQG